MSLVVTCPICDGDAVRTGRGQWVCPACDHPPPVVPTFGCPRCGELTRTDRRVTIGVANPQVMRPTCAAKAIGVLERAG